MEQRRRNSRSHTAERIIEHCELVFLLVIFSKILIAIDLALKYFWYEKADLCLAIDHLENVGLLTTTTGYREGFTEAKLESISVDQKLWIEVKFQDKRVKKTKRHFDELADDHRLNTPVDRFRIVIFIIAFLILWMHNCKPELKECMK